MYTTRFGTFPIGFRRGWSDWQKDLPSVISWAKENDFAAVDLGRGDTIVEEITAVREAGLSVGSVDLKEWHALMSPDAAKRADAVTQNIAYIKECVAAGAKNFFVVMLPAEPKRARRENFDDMVESLNALAPTLEQTGAKLVIEGYPGEGALCCTPESYRATFAACPSASIGINYDPSHLLRMGIDPIRFLKEFVSRVSHVHGKDCEILMDDLYEYGWEQPATFKSNPAFGSTLWRYTIPGQGNTNWGEVCRILAANSYTGAICIELEDRDYNGTEDGEKLGIVSGAQFLSTC